MQLNDVLELGKEYPPEGEDDLINELVKILAKDLDDRGMPVFRQQHPKSHGLVKGELIVDPNLAADLKIGIFKQAKYDILIRFSNASNERQNGNFLPDTVGGARGMTIKVLNVENSQTSEQDLVMVNHPVMFVRDVQGYLDFEDIRQGMQDGRIVLKPGEAPQVDDSLNQQFQAIAYAFPILQKIKSKATTSLLDIIYWSTTPYKLGDRVIKFQVVPQQTQTFNLDNSQDKENYLREGMKVYLQAKDAYFDFKIQLQTDANSMPVEDPTIEWDKSKSPFIKVATIKIPHQEFDTDKIREQDEKISFSPWHCLPEHQPLGGVNRSRKKVYDVLSQKRNQMNATKEESSKADK